MDFGSRARRAQTPGPGAASSRENSVERTRSDQPPATGITDQALGAAQSVKPLQSASASTDMPSSPSLGAGLRDDDGGPSDSVENRLSQLSSTMAQQSLANEPSADEASTPRDKDEEDDSESDYSMEDVPMGLRTSFAVTPNAQELQCSVQDRNGGEKESANLPNDTLREPQSKSLGEEQIKKTNTTSSKSHHNEDNKTESSQGKSTPPKEPAPIAELNDTDDNTVHCHQDHIRNEGNTQIEVELAHAVEQPKSIHMQQSQDNDSKDLSEGQQVAAAEDDRGRRNAPKPCENTRVEEGQINTSAANARHNQQAISVEDVQATKLSNESFSQTQTKSTEITAVEAVNTPDTREDHQVVPDDEPRSKSPDQTHSMSAALEQDSSDTVLLQENARSDQNTEPSSVASDLHSTKRPEHNESHDATVDTQEDRHSVPGDNSISTSSSQTQTEPTAIEKVKIVVAEAQPDSHSTESLNSQAGQKSPTHPIETPLETVKKDQRTNAEPHAVSKEQPPLGTTEKGSRSDPEVSQAAQSGMKHNVQNETSAPDATPEQSTTKATGSGAAGMKPIGDKDERAHKNTGTFKKDAVPQTTQEQYTDKVLTETEKTNIKPTDGVQGEEANKDVHGIMEDEEQQTDRVTEIAQVDPGPTDKDQEEKSTNTDHGAAINDTVPQPTRVTEAEEANADPTDERQENGATQDTDIVMEDAAQSREPQQPSFQEAAKKETMQPSLDIEASKASKLPGNNEGQQETMQPSIDHSKEVAQPSIDPGSLQQTKISPRVKVNTWLGDNETRSAAADQDPSASTGFVQKNGFLGQSDEDLHRLQAYLAQHDRDTDDESMAAGEEAAHGWVDNAAETPSPTPTPLPPLQHIQIPSRNRNRERAPAGERHQRARKRKRGNSKAGRRAKKGSKSRDAEEEDQGSVVSMERPQRGEFEVLKYQRLEPQNFVWGPQRAPRPLDTSKLQNIGVQVVDPMYDGDEQPERFRGTGGAIVTRSIPVREATPVRTLEPPRRRKREIEKRRKQARQVTPTMEVDEDRDIDMTEVTEVEEAREMTPVKEPLSLRDLPYEILRKIFHELLISRAHIYVYEGFTKVYPANRRRARLEIQTAILLACKRTYHVGIRVLYGENTFVYSLRDAPGQTAPRPVDVDKLVQDDASTQASGDDEDEDVDDDASEWLDDGMDEDEDDHVINRRHRRQKAKGWDGDIRIAKYFSLFRHIVVEAEHNRYGNETMTKMAEAITFWSKAQEYTPDKASLFPHEKPVELSQPKSKKKRKGRAPKEVQYKPQSQLANVHTLTIRIFPTYKENNKQEGDFTFVSFFEADSPVIAALKTTLPQYIRIAMIWKYMHVASQPSCMTVDMRPLRIKHRIEQGCQDIWRRDKLVLVARRDGVNKVKGALSRVQGHVRRHCEKKYEIRQTEGGHAPNDMDDEGWWLGEDIADEPGEFVE